MQKFKHCLLIVFVFYFAANVSAQSVIDGERLKLIPGLVNEYIDSGKIPFANVLISHNGQIVFNESFGGVNENSIFRIASMSKIITSVAVLQLAEQGKFLLTDRIDKFIPEFADTKKIEPDSVNENGKAVSYKIVKAKRAPTIYELLTHTSGVPYTFSDNEYINKLYRDAGVNEGTLPTDKTIAENVKTIASLPLLFEPGTNWEYGLSSDVLGYLVEIISGMNLEEYLTENIFEPLEMVDTYFHLPKGKANRLVPMFSIDENKKVFKLSDENHEVNGLRFHPDFPIEGKSKLESGGGGLVSTIKDYYNFCSMILNEGEFKGHRVLSPTFVKLFTRMPEKFGTVTSGYHFSFGSAVRTEPELALPGELMWAGIFYTRFYIDPNESLIILLFSQTIPYSQSDLHKKIRAITYHSLVD